ncbi:hypothetical protein CYMTET_11892 [Cymbomonas tetramitiformis]|uniref:Uncharacterized protein n=1 Tax=Cymbomonas tetramitiformis TaxID=36881 RepID=A0AAE0GLK8_9CHLO|nr:hypothetical protein CYMTET_11892 [Cymbomonas tetramitiformis]
MRAPPASERKYSHFKSKSMQHPNLSLKLKEDWLLALPRLQEHSQPRMPQSTRVERGCLCGWSMPEWRVHVGDVKGGKHDSAIPIGTTSVALPIPLRPACGAFRRAFDSSAETLQACARKG